MSLTTQSDFEVSSYQLPPPAQFKRHSPFAEAPQSFSLARSFLLGVLAGTLVLALWLRESEPVTPTAAIKPAAAVVTRIETMEVANAQSGMTPIKVIGPGEVFVIDPPKPRAH